jgi:hypothetical protein
MTSECDKTSKWNSSGAHKIIQDISVEHTPWQNRFRDYQLDVVSEVLDGTDLFYVDGTGFGQSSVLYHYLWVSEMDIWQRKWMEYRLG